MNNLLNIKSFLKFLSKNKVYTLIDVFGLSVSLMFVILIAIYTVQELATDRYHENGDRIYALGNENGEVTAVPVPYWLEERYPEIEKICPVIPHGGDGMPVYYGDKKLKGECSFVDSTFFDFFSFKLIEGLPNQVLQDQYSAVVSETFANKMFGSENPVGKSLRLRDSTSVVVTGIMEDIRKSVLPYSDMLVRIERVVEFNPSLSKTNAGNAGATVGFLMLQKGANLESKKDDMMAYFKETFWPYQIDVWKEITITPLNDLYFTSFSSSNLNHGDRNFVLVLMSVGILILIFAIFNYINLTVAQAGQRAKEMATRRLMGSSRKELFLRLMLESVGLTVVSFAVGLFLAWAFLPYANELLDTRLYMSEACTPVWIGTAIGMIILVGVLAGLLPALLISAAKPIEIVRGTFRRQTKMIFSKCFITFQNTITIATLAAALIMGLQIYHMIKAPLGYNTRNILVLQNQFRSGSEMAAAMDRIRQLTCVRSVGFSNGTPFSGTNNLTGVYEGKSLSFQQMTLDSAAFKMLGLEILKDNRVASAGERGHWYLTERAFRDMELSQDANVFHHEGSEPATILGVIKDFHLRNIVQESSPVMLRFRDFDREDDFPWNILIEVEGDPYTALTSVREIVEDVTKIEFEGEYLDEGIQKSFDSQIRLVKIVVLFAYIAILISLLGLLAMSTYFIQQRSQEIAIRKVFGSENREILVRLVGTFLNYVGIAFIIATPVCWYFMRDWLSSYSYRISLTPLLFILPGLFCVVVSLLAVFVQSYRAATANPVDSVKNN